MIWSFGRARSAPQRHFFSLTCSICWAWQLWLRCDLFKYQKYSKMRTAENQTQCAALTYLPRAKRLNRSRTMFTETLCQNTSLTIMTELSLRLEFFTCQDVNAFPVTNKTGNAAGVCCMSLFFPLFAMMFGASNKQNLWGFNKRPHSVTSVACTRKNSGPQVDSWMMWNYF